MLNFCWSLIPLWSAWWSKRIKITFAEASIVFFFLTIFEPWLIRPICSRKGVLTIMDLIWDMVQLVCGGKEKRNILMFLFSSPPQIFKKLQFREKRTSSVHLKTGHFSFRVGREWQRNVTYIQIISIARAKFLLLNMQISDVLMLLLSLRLL